MNRQCGAALLVALWIIALASLLLGNLAVSVQLQQRQALWQRHSTQASLAAEAGVNLAVAGLLRDESSAWQPDGRVHEGHFAGSKLRIRVRSERGKLDLNAADERDIKALLRVCNASGGDRDRAGQQVAQALLPRRETLPLRMLDELRALPGMSNARYHCLLPDITVWSGVPRPDPTLASRRLATTLGLPRSDAPPRNAGQIFTISAEATLPDGFRDQLDVTLVLRTGMAGRKPYRVLGLGWQE